MKKDIKKGILSLFACICMVSLLVISASAESITITHYNGSATGYSYHAERTPNGVNGISEGNCVHNSSGTVYYYAYVGGSSTFKCLYAYSRTSGGVLTTYYNDVKTGAIENNPSITFDRSYRTEIAMEESAFTGNDRWFSTYKYIWDYYSAEARMTLVSGTYY